MTDLGLFIKIFDESGDSEAGLGQSEQTFVLNYLWIKIFILLLSFCSYLIYLSSFIFSALSYRLSIVEYKLVGDVETLGEKYLVLLFFLPNIVSTLLNFGDSILALLFE